ncbi:MAG: 50S ribosomal protein L21 [SAR324 cluster bacterium]|nr:50S ribosomal protein L21 [SAR324 cluster bacterium]
MYSIINCGGKQHKVIPGDKILVNKLSLEVGEEFESDQVLAHKPEKGSIQIGHPLLKQATYKAKVERSFKDKKIIVFKKKRRKNYRRKNGHRQDLMEVSIVSINLGV